MGTEIKGLEPANDAVRVVFNNGHTEVFRKFLLSGWQHSKKLS